MRKVGAVGLWKTHVVAVLVMLTANSLVLFGTASRAAAHGGDESVFHVCITRRHAARFVAPAQNCRPGETAAHWPLNPTQGPQGPPGPVGPQGPPANTLAVFTVDDVRVGDVIDLDGATGKARVLVHAGEQSFLVKIGRTMIEGFLDRLYYETTDCSGPPFLQPLSADRLLPVVAIGPPGSTAWGAVPGSSSQQITYRSSWSTLSRQCEVPQPSSISAIPAAFLLDIGSFSAPFSVR